MITIAVCDDENYMLEELRGRIASYLSLKHLNGEIRTFSSAEELLESGLGFDIIFLDIQMIGLNGMEAAHRLRKSGESSLLIFCTVLKELVFEAFEVEAFCYLVKPIEEDKLFRVLDRAVKRLEGEENTYLGIHKGNSYWRIKIEDIYYCEVIKRKIYVHMRDRIFDYYESIERLEKTIGAGFFRCHRSYLVNLRFVKGYMDSNAVLENGGRIPVSRLRQQEFTEAVLNYLKGRGQ